MTAPQQMKVRDVIMALLDCPMNSDVYIGKGMGPLAKVDPQVHDRIIVVLSPGGSR